MTAALRDVFADTGFWIALVVKQDQFHERAQEWALQVTGRITTTIPVLFETANALARPAWRAQGVALLEHLQQRNDVEVVALTPEMWLRGVGALQKPPGQSLESHGLRLFLGDGRCRAHGRANAGRAFRAGRFPRGNARRAVPVIGDGDRAIDRCIAVPPGMLFTGPSFNPEPTVRRHRLAPPSPLAPG
jgi:hypothetical protein